MEADADARAYDALSQHPRLSDLAAMARALMTSAARELRRERDADQIAALTAERGLTRDEAATPFGNALDVLDRGPEGDAERALACGLAGQAIAASPPSSPEEQKRLGGDLLWLAANTPFDATGLVDRALGDGAGPIWAAVGDCIRRIDAGTAPVLGRGEALVGAVALAGSTSPVAAKVGAALARELHDAKIARVLAVRPDVEALEPVTGEIVAAPRGPVATTLLAMTGLLFVTQGARVLARLALANRRPAQVTLAEGGAVRVRWHAELLGRTLKEHDVLVPRASLSRATRDVRFPRLGLYAGLLALAVGSFVGVSTLVDGARTASPSLLVSGLVVVVLGLGIDFALANLLPSTRGRCRLLLESRDGVRLCVGNVDVARADALLERLAAR